MGNGIQTIESTMAYREAVSHRPGDVAVGAAMPGDVAVGAAHCGAILCRITQMECPNLQLFWLPFSFLMRQHNAGHNFCTLSMPSTVLVDSLRVLAVPGNMG